MSGRGRVKKIHNYQFAIRNYYPTTKVGGLNIDTTCFNFYIIKIRGLYPNGSIIQLCSQLRIALAHR